MSAIQALKAGRTPAASRLRSRCLGIDSADKSVALLRTGNDGWSGEDWRALFDERAAIAEFDGGMPRASAEARAFACCVVEWLNRNPVRSPPGRCLGCGGNENAQDKLLPFGIEPTGHAWLHSRCWDAWHAGRKAEAVAALSTFGICLRTSP